MGGECKWPTVEEAKNYRLKCKDLINKIIDRTELVLPITNKSPWVTFFYSDPLCIELFLINIFKWAILMGIEHENIHFETSSVLIRQYPINMVTRPFGWVKDGPTGGKYFMISSKINVNLINKFNTRYEISGIYEKQID